MAADMDLLIFSKADESECCFVKRDLRIYLLMYFPPLFLLLLFPLQCLLLTRITSAKSLKYGNKNHMEQLATVAGQHTWAGEWGEWRTMVDRNRNQET